MIISKRLYNALINISMEGYNISVSSPYYHKEITEAVNRLPRKVKDEMEYLFKKKKGYKLKI